jgi:hypothetical protein
MPNFGFFGLQIYHLATLLQIGIPASACSMAAVAAADATGVYVIIKSPT